MARECELCGKQAHVGHQVSHSNIKTKRLFRPNLQKVRHQHSDGQVVTLRVCTRCLRSGTVIKPASRQTQPA